MACITPAACSRASAPMAARIFKGTEHSERLKRSAQDPRLRDPLFGRRDRRRQAAGAREERQARTPMSARSPGAARRRWASRRMNNTIHLAIANWEWPSYFDPGAAAEGHPARPRRISPARSDDRAGARQGRRPLHDLHHLQAQGRAQRLCRRHDAGLAGPRRRMHRRQHLLHQGRQDPHADRRLFPRRHHPRRP